MDFSHRNLYCVECKDYVYDLEILDRIIRLETLRLDIGGRYPGGARARVGEMKEMDSTLLPCRAAAQKTTVRGVASI